MSSPLPGNIVLFDGVCNLCNGLVKFIIRHDTSGKIKFAPLQSDIATELISGRVGGFFDADGIVYISGERYFNRSTAILHILKDMGKAWKAFYGFIIIPRFMRDALYNIVARNRYYIFGKRNSCMVPTPDIRDRFLY